MHDHTHTPCCSTTKPSIWQTLRDNRLLIISLLILGLSYGAYGVMHMLSLPMPQYLHHFAHISASILGSMWWGVVLGIIIVGFMSEMPREMFTVIMGKNDSVSGLLRAIFAGVFLDLCCHGILLVAAKLYERGVGLGQVMAFLIASPWNSFSLTFILIGLIGFGWTMAFILCSALIALVTGFIIHHLVRRGTLPQNPHSNGEAVTTTFKAQWRIFVGNVKASSAKAIAGAGWRDGKMIIKWLLFGTIIAAALRTFIPADVFAAWLGPSLAGLMVTLVAATILEICSEGSAPVASEIVTTAGAAGNGFTFLMAGVATDYTEIMAIRTFTQSWRSTLILPLLTVPQVLVIGWVMNGI